MENIPFNYGLAKDSFGILADFIDRGSDTRNRFWNRRSLHTLPRIPVQRRGVDEFMRLSLRRTAHVDVAGKAK
jgi:hypothetical protein